MKTFLFEKVVGFEEEEMLTPKAKANAAEVKIKDEKKFNCIVVNNPQDSNCICVINNIYLDLIVGNEMCLSPGELEDENKPSLKYSNLNITCKYSSEEIYDESGSRMKIRDKHFEVLNRHYVILIPGGSLHIRLKDAVKEAALKVNWSEENL